MQKFDLTECKKTSEVALGDLSRTYKELLEYIAQLEEENKNLRGVVQHVLEKLHGFVYTYLEAGTER